MTSPDILGFNVLVDHDGETLWLAPRAGGFKLNPGVQPWYLTSQYSEAEEFANEADAQREGETWEKAHPADIVYVLALLTSS